MNTLKNTLIVVPQPADLEALLTDVVQAAQRRGATVLSAQWLHETNSIPRLQVQFLLPAEALLEVGRDPRSTPD